MKAGERNLGSGKVERNHTVKVTLVKQAPVAVVARHASCLQETWEKFGGNQFRLTVAFKYEIQEM